MPAASILVKPCSSECNIGCTYCFYKKICKSRSEYSKGFMSTENLDRLIKNGIEYADDYVSFAFQGGEPMLAGIDFYRKAVELEKIYTDRCGKNMLTVENTIQTNGVLINDEWAEFFADNNFLVGVSIDGPRKIHDANRHDLNGNGTFEKVMNGIAILKKHGVQFNVAAVVTDAMTAKASYVYNFFKRNGFRFIQLIPCMGDNQVSAVGYGQFLCEIFDLWYEDFMNGADIEIRTFSNLAQMAAGYQAEECGMNGRCNCYFVVEGDGSIYPCDFYCTDEYRIGTLTDAFADMAGSAKAAEFVARSECIDSQCLSCRYYKFCRGGCTHWRLNGLNMLCEAYETFFDHTISRIEQLGELVKNSQQHFQ